MTNRNLLLLLPLLLLLLAGCTNDDDDDSVFNRIAAIGRANGWTVDAVISDYDTRVNTAIDNLTEEEIAADPRSRDELREQYTPIIRTAITVDDCDRDDVLFFVENGVMRIIQGDVACGAGADPNPLARFNDRSYTVNTDATEMSIRANTGEFLGLYEIVELNAGSFIFEQEATVADSVFTDLTYNIRYELAPN